MMSNDLDSFKEVDLFTWLQSHYGLFPMRPPPLHTAKALTLALVVDYAAPFARCFSR
jgi:hypothetical protein